MHTLSCAVLTPNVPDGAGTLNDRVSRVIPTGAVCVTPSSQVRLYGGTPPAKSALTMT